MSKLLTMKRDFKPGDWVRSRFRAQWTGVVVEYEDKPKDHCVIVEVMGDRHDKKTTLKGYRKLKTLDQHWLKKTNPPSFFIPKTQNNDG